MKSIIRVDITNIQIICNFYRLKIVQFKSKVIDKYSTINFVYIFYIINGKNTWQWVAVSFGLLVIKTSNTLRDVSLTDELIWLMAQAKYLVTISKEGAICSSFTAIRTDDNSFTANLRMSASQSSVKRDAASKNDDRWTAIVCGG